MKLTPKNDNSILSLPVITFFNSYSLSRNPFTDVPLPDLYFVRSTLEYLDLSETHIKVLISDTPSITFELDFNSRSTYEFIITHLNFASR